MGKQAIKALNNYVQTTAPGNLDEKMEWFEQNEKSMLGKFVEETWKKLFPLAAKEKEANDYYLKLWRTLNNTHRVLSLPRAL